MTPRGSTIGVALVAVIGLAVGVMANLNLTSDSEPGLGSSLRALPKPRAITDFALTDMNGAAFNKARLMGSWHVLFFGFTHCPDVCPITLSNVAKALASDSELARQLNVVFVSVDPARDNAESLREYVGFFDERFLGVTGEHPQLAALTRQLGTLYTIDPQGTGDSDYTVDHGASLLVLNPEARMVGDLPPPHDPLAIARDLSQLILSR